MILIIIIVFHFESKYINVIQKSKNDRAKCERYGINFFDTSGNRGEKIDQIIKEIEVKSIN